MKLIPLLISPLILLASCQKNSPSDLTERTLDSAITSTPKDVKEFQFAKLAITYTNSNKLDIFENHSDNVEQFTLPNGNGKFARLDYDTRERIFSVYGSTNKGAFVQNFDTGIESHFDHMHGGRAISNPAYLSNDATIPKWNGAIMTSFMHSDGSILYADGEYITQGIKPLRTEKVEDPHQGFALTVDQYLIVTAQKHHNSQKNGDFIKIYKNDFIQKNLHLKSPIFQTTINDIGEILSGSSFANRLGIFTTTKGLYIVSPRDIFKQTLIDHIFKQIIISNALIENNKLLAFDQKGLYEVNVETGAVVLLINLDKIKNVELIDDFDHQKYIKSSPKNNPYKYRCVILTDDNRLYLYDLEKVPTLVGSTQSLFDKSDDVKMTASRNYVYYGKVGETLVQRRKLQDLSLTSPFTLNGKLSDMLMIGNVKEVVVNNH